MFLTIEDYKAVVDGKTLEVIHQSDPANLQRAERYAIDEIKSYLKAAYPNKTGLKPYDTNATFAATGSDRNSQLVMYCCDISLYHFIAWLPQRIGFEIREKRYKQAIDWLEKVQKGDVVLDLPFVDNPAENQAKGSIRYGGLKKSVYGW